MSHSISCIISFFKASVSYRAKRLGVRLLGPSGETSGDIAAVGSHAFVAAILTEEDRGRGSDVRLQYYTNLSCSTTSNSLTRPELPRKLVKPRMSSEWQFNRILTRQKCMQRASDPCPMAHSAAM